MQTSSSPWRARFQGLLSHMGAIAVSVAAAFQLRFEFSLPPDLNRMMWQGILLALLTKLPVFLAGRLLRNLRIAADVADLHRLLAWNALGSAAFSLVVSFWIGPAFPRSVYLIDFLVCVMATAVLRFATSMRRQGWKRPKERRKGILVYGAGVAGAMLLREIRGNPSLPYRVVGLLDDDVSKHGAHVLGLPVVGSGRDAAAIVARLNRLTTKVEEIVIAIPSATGKERRQAVSHCQAARIPFKTVPGLGDLLRQKVLVSQIRDVSLSDLLGRPPVRIDAEPIRSQLEGSRVLITGAAGSIGSELCRQIAQFHPGQLVAFDQAESELYRVECELRKKYPGLALVPAIGDVRNASRIAEVLDAYNIDSVFHAAAYKHVPMMECHVLEAVETNVLGTWNLINAVRSRRISRFVMISSDKAVNPTNVMGATKRACELIVATPPPDSRRNETKCVSVRFGNVLGSNGSVVPIFQEQIAAGGPVTVTHPDIQRFFMTTAEAVSLVLQASGMGKGAEIFVLDMGEPVRIVDLAKNMIRLAGLVPYEDVDISFVGLRPGEKLFEEINCAYEQMLPTYHEKIRIFQQAQPDWAMISSWITRLRIVAGQRQEDAIVEHLQEIVPEYQPSSRFASLPAQSPRPRSVSRPEPAELFYERGLQQPTS